MTMWRLYAGGLCTGFALGGAVCWLAVLSILPESARGNLLINPFFPWGVFLAFVLAGETLRRKVARIAEPSPTLNLARKQGGRRHQETVQD
jgi:hypothetical protein